MANKYKKYTENRKRTLFERHKSYEFIEGFAIKLKLVAKLLKTSLYKTSSRQLK